MKNVEEHSHKNFPYRKQWVEWIQQIQLDAAKWGAEQAANKINAEDETNNCSACRRHLKDVKQAILAFANNLTIDQLPK